MTAQREIELTPAMAKEYDDVLAERRALMEASELIARQFTEKLRANNDRLTACYTKAAAKFGLDLNTQAYEYDTEAKVLFLTQQRFSRG